MAEEKKSIFRKESLDRISSPEEYDQYLKVTGPGVWIVLSVIVLLLAGAIVWAVFGRLDTRMETIVFADDQSVTCIIPSDQMNAVKKGSMKIEIAGQEYDLIDNGRAEQKITQGGDYASLLTYGYTDGTKISIMDIDAALNEGVYEGQIEVEKVAPIYFILN